MFGCSHMGQPVPRRKKTGWFGCLRSLLGPHRTKFKAALGLSPKAHSDRQFLGSQALSRHVGHGSCTRGATLEKSHCFPKRRQLLPSPSLTALSPLPSLHSPTARAACSRSENNKSISGHLHQNLRRNTSAMEVSIFSPLHLLLCIQFEFRFELGDWGIRVLP